MRHSCCPAIQVCGGSKKPGSHCVCAPAPGGAYQRQLKPPCRPGPPATREAARGARPCSAPPSAGARTPSACPGPASPFHSVPANKRDESLPTRRTGRQERRPLAACPPENTEQQATQQARTHAPRLSRAEPSVHQTTCCFSTPSWRPYDRARTGVTHGQAQDGQTHAQQRSHTQRPCDWPPAGPPALASALLKVPLPRGPFLRAGQACAGVARGKGSLRACHGERTCGVPAALPDQAFCRTRPHSRGCGRARLLHLLGVR